MNAPSHIATTAGADIALYRAVRSRMPDLAADLSAEDLGAQAMADASPGKWHLAHTSWFFEAMILAADPAYEPVDPRFQQLFNSYYEALGRRVERPERGLMTRPSLDEVLTYRREIDRRMIDRLGEGLTDGASRYLFGLGLHHDQQHQELFLMDLLNLMSRSPLDPAAYAEEPRERSADRAASTADWSGWAMTAPASPSTTRDRPTPSICSPSPSITTWSPMATGSASSTTTATPGRSCGCRTAGPRSRRRTGPRPSTGAPTPTAGPRWA